MSRNANHPYYRNRKKKEYQSSSQSDDQSIDDLNIPRRMDEMLGDYNIFTELDLGMGEKEAKVISFPLGFRNRRIWAGPYRNKPVTMDGIKLAPEIKMPYLITVPIKDFGVPNQHDMRQAIVDTLQLVAQGKKLYVGCFGGIGRTGLFLACLAKALGVPEPLEWVRAVYLPYAVETKAQEKFIEDFDIGPIKWKIHKIKFMAWVRFWKY